MQMVKRLKKMRLKHLNGIKNQLNKKTVMHIAQYQLGRCYANGKGIEKDEVKAFEWYKKSAKQEDSNAQYQLGQCYKDGIGVEKDEVKAFKWYKKSAKQGNSNAQNKLVLCYESG